MGIVTDEHREHFSRWGFVVLEGVLSPSRDLAPVWEEWGRILDGVAEVLFQSGQVTSTYRGLPLSQRLIALTKESKHIFARYLDPSLPEKGLIERPAMDVGPAMFSLLRNAAILDVIEEFIGPEIYSNPIQHVRMKYPKSALEGMPRSGTTHGPSWHQDNGVVTPDALETEMLTVWIPFTAATVENGCLQVVPGSHRRGLVDHCGGIGGYLGLSDRAIGDHERRPLPMEPGSMLLMHRHTMHGSEDNESERDLRISLDLRYQRTGEPTGRADFPGFVARSERDPSTELRDPVAWANSWTQTRDRLYRSETNQIGYRQWGNDSELCA